MNIRFLSKGSPNQISGGYLYNKYLIEFLRQANVDVCYHSDASALGRIDSADTVVVDSNAYIGRPRFPQLRPRTQGRGGPAGDASSPPGRALRERFIAQYAKSYDYESADIEELLAMTEGTTPAFIKEWIHRTVQIATERLDGDDAKLSLTTEDFREAHTEMKRFTEGSTGRIVGFIGPEG